MLVGKLDLPCDAAPRPGVPPDLRVTVLEQCCPLSPTWRETWGEWSR